VVLPIQGTAFYIDKKSDVGSAVLHLQDQTNSPVNSLFVTPGDAHRIPFPSWWWKNLAQPGLVLRIHYGADVQFQAGLSSIVRPAWYDRNAVSKAISFAATTVAPHASVIRATLHGARWARRQCWRC